MPSDHRQHQEAGLGRRRAVHDLHVERQDHDPAEHGDADDDAGGDGHGGRTDPEQLGRDQGRVADGALDQHERRRGRQRRDDVAGHGAAVGPAPLAALLGHGQQRHEHHDQGQRAPPVDPDAAGLARGARHVQGAEDHHQRGEADRHVDEEDPAPAGDAEQVVAAGEEAADERAEHARRPEHRHEVAGVLGALARRDDVADDREHEREQAARAEALEGTERRELRHRRRERAERRAEDEHRDREHEELLAPVEVAELAVDRRRDGAGDQVGGRHPGLHRQPLQVVGDGADRRADDGLVEGTEEHAHHQARQDGHDLLVGVLAGLLGLGVGCHRQRS